MSQLDHLNTGVGDLEASLREWRLNRSFRSQSRDPELDTVVSLRPRSARGTALEVGHAGLGSFGFATVVAEFRKATEACASRFASRMESTIQWLNGVPFAGLMLVVALGFGLGRLSWRGLSLGPAGGTIAVALLLGRYGLDLHEVYAGGAQGFTVGDFGFALFIYSVGFEAGPRFFATLLGGPGWRFVLVGGVVNVSALLIALSLGTLFDLSDALSAGVLAGALTSPPTFAAAEVLTSDPTALAVSFALTYPIGLAGVVLMVQFLPRLMGDDLSKGLEDPRDRRRGRPRGTELTRAFRVTHEGVVGPTLRELDLTHNTGCYVTGLHRSDSILAVDADTCLEVDDHLLARGRLDELQALAQVLGPEVYDDELRKSLREAHRVRITANEAVGQSLRELDLTRRFHCFVSTVERDGQALEPEAELRLERGDVALLMGRREDVRPAVRTLGRLERSSSETDIGVYAGGIFLGLLLGHAHMSLFGAHLTLGVAGGLLLTGILLGRFRDLGLFHAHVPLAARQLVRDLGILLFVAERGIIAGGSGAGVMKGHLLATLGGSVLVVGLSVTIAALVGRYLFKLRSVDTWGSIGGGMTSSSALVAVKRAADSEEPALSYVASYAVACVLATVAGQLIVQLLL